MKQDIRSVIKEVNDWLHSQEIGDEVGMANLIEVADKDENLYYTFKIEREAFEDCLPVSMTPSGTIRYDCYIEPEVSMTLVAVVDKASGKVVDVYKEEGD